jgi:OHCU decarboxylase
LKEANAQSNIGNGLERLNSLPAEAASTELVNCCGSRRWAEQLSEHRPFVDLAALLEQADRIWWSLDQEDWLEAFRSHPKIGERKTNVAAAARSRKWSEGEQAGARGASQETMDALAEANRTYESKFGFIFIVCATGKTAEEMLRLLRQRLANDHDTELRIAAEEQRRITHLRLQKLLDT